MAIPGHRMRRRDTVCKICGKITRIEFDLDTGKLDTVDIPKECKFPNKYPSDHLHGIMDRGFGEKIIMPKL